MKENLLLMLLSFCISFSYAQNPVPNQSFENWSNGDPVDWFTSNIPGFLTNVVQTNDAQIGSSAIRLNVVDFDGLNLGGIIVSTDANAVGFPISSNYGSVLFYYKMDLQTGDEFFNTNILSDAGGNAVCGGSLVMTPSNNTSVYTQAVVPLFLFGGLSQEGLINFAITNSNGIPSLSTWVQIDNVVLSTASDITEFEAKNLKLENPQPNPSSAYTLIPFSTNEKGKVRIDLYDVNGRFLLNILSEDLSKGNYKAELNCSTLPAGLYNIVLVQNGKNLCRTMSVVH